VGAKCRRSPRNLLAELAAITSQIWAQQSGRLANLAAAPRSCVGLHYLGQAARCTLIISKQIYYVD
jgi:hypothetical protein